jgi:hypothetical protein
MGQQLLVAATHVLTRPGRVVGAEELAVPELQDVHDAKPDRHAAGAAMGDDMPEHYDVIARVDQLLNVDAEVAELLHQLPFEKPVSQFLRPAIYGSVRKTR